MIGFGQDDCGEKPVYKGNKFGQYKTKKEYKEYKKSLDIWKECKESELIEGPCEYGLNEFDKFLKVNKKETKEVTIYNWFTRIAFSLANYNDRKYLILNYSTSGDSKNMYCKGDKLYLLSRNDETVEFTLTSEAGKDCSYGITKDLYYGSSTTLTDYKLFFTLSESKLIELKDFDLKSIRIYNSNGTYNEHDVAEKGLHLGGISKKKLTNKLKIIKNMFSSDKLNCIN